MAATQTQSSLRKRPMRLAARRRQQRLIGLGMVLVGGLLLYTGSGYLLTHPKLSFTTITINGTETLNPKAIEATAWHTMSTTRGLCMFAGTIATYDKEHLVRSLAYAYPRIATATAHAESIETLTITLTERTASARWCRDIDCHLLDADGFVFEKVATSSHTELITYRGNMLGEPLRQSFLHGDFAQTHDFITSLASLGITPREVLLEEVGASVHSLAHPTLKLKLDTTLTRTHSYIETVINSPEYLKAKESAATEETPLNYIDLRFGNRVYYK